MTNELDAKELLQFNALLEARAAAGGLDLSSIGPETRERVAAMLKSRRTRMLDEEKEYLEELRTGEAEKQFEKQIAATMEDDEKVSRVVVVRQEKKDYDRIIKVFDEQFQHLSAGMLTLRQQKEIEASRAKKMKALEQELNKQRFYLYWEQHSKQRAELLKTGQLAMSPGGSKKSSAIDASSPEAQVHRMTAVLRRAYEKSAPLFATDPEELWKRGQALPPTATASSTTAGGEVELPPYHEFGAKVREKYAKFARENGVGASVGVPANQSMIGNNTSPLSSSGRHKSSASYPYQQDSPFGTAIAKTLHDQKF